MNGHAIREAARAIAFVVHDGQSRKGAGEPYFNHCARVADSVWGWRAKAIAYLHDTIEDSPNPEKMTEALEVIFWADRSIIRDVRMLSRLPDETGAKITYDEFISRLIEWNSKDALQVKLADVNDNLGDIEDIPGAQNLYLRYIKAKARLEEALAD